MMEPKLKDMTEKDSEVAFIPLSPAEGAIEAGESQHERLEEFTRRVGAGEFHRETTGQIPCKCIDGRCSQLDALMPNSAGGSETLMVADDLTTKRFADKGTTTAAQYEATLGYLVAAGQPIGGHTAEDLHGAPSGCGANDKLASIYEMMARKGEAIRGIAATLGVEVDDQTHQLLMQNATARGEQEFSDGAELLAILEQKTTEHTDPEVGVDVLKGAHKEVIATINTRPGTTLDRDAVRAEFGDDYQAFNIDVWSFRQGAEVITPTEGLTDEAREREISQKVAAMVYYNVATALVLCGPNMRVVPLK